MTYEGEMDRNLALEAVRVTEAAALAASRLMGRGDEKAADQAAVNAMRQALNGLAIEGTVMIGEGERDEAPMLYIGEEVGSGGPKIDIALDPLEGTTLTAKGGPNALAVIAMAGSGGFLNAPDTYMDKIAVGGGLPADLVDLDEDPAVNLKNLARGQEGRHLRPGRLRARPAAPQRDRSSKLREAGARIMLIGDGDVSGVIATSRPDSGVDIYMGIGGAPEGRAGGGGAAGVSAASSRAGWCSATTRNGPAASAGASPTSSASTACTSSPAATSCSRPPGSPTAPCSRACGASPAAPAPRVHNHALEIRHRARHRRGCIISSARPGTDEPDVKDS